MFCEPKLSVDELIVNKPEEKVQQAVTIHYESKYY